MTELKLYMLLLGCRPEGRFTEQHDVFFGIAHSLKELVPQIKAAWPEAKGNIHIDAWREVRFVNGYRVDVKEKGRENLPGNAAQVKLFFINLGGYKKDEFEEYHYKMLIASADVSGAIKNAKQAEFFYNTGFKGANAHVDDKFTLDVDEVHEVGEMLPAVFKKKYELLLHEDESDGQDEIHLGFLQLWKIREE